MIFDLRGELIAKSQVHIVPYYSPPAGLGGAGLRVLLGQFERGLPEPLAEPS